MNRLLQRLGACGVLGIGMLAACAAFYASALAPLQEALAAQQAVLERLRTRTPYQPVAADAQTEKGREALYRFYSLFPPAEALTGEVERLHRLALRAGLDLAQGEYRLERRPAGLWAYRATLPVRGTYAALREFTAAVITDMPIASIETLRFERKAAAETELEAQLRITLHVRPGADLQ